MKKKTKGNPIRLPLPPPGAGLVSWLFKRLPIKIDKGAVESIRWWNPSRDVKDLEMKGFLPGTSGVFYSMIGIFLGLGCLHDQLEVKGLKNVKAFIKSLEKDENATGCMLADHKGFADIFVIQVVLAIKARLWDLVLHRILPLIGSLYLECYPVESAILRASPRVAAIPPTMLSEDAPEEDKRAAAKIDMAAKKAFKKGLQGKYHLRSGWFETVLRKFLLKLLGNHDISRLGDRFIGLGFAEGTRSRSAEMLRAKAGMTSFIKRKGGKILPIALEGTEHSFPPAEPGSLIFPNFFKKLRIIFLPPIDWETVDEEATRLSKEFPVSYNQAAIDYVYRQIALGHINHGEARYAGYYSRPLEEIYAEELQAA